MKCIKLQWTYQLDRDVLVVALDKMHSKHDVLVAAEVESDADVVAVHTVEDIDMMAQSIHSRAVASVAVAVLMKTTGFHVDLINQWDIMNEN